MGDDEGSQSLHCSQFIAVLECGLLMLLASIRHHVFFFFFFLHKDGAPPPFFFFLHKPVPFPVTYNHCFLTHEQGKGYQSRD